MRFSVSNWPVATRLIAVFIAASVTGLVFGGLRVADAMSSANGYARTTQLAVLGKQVTLLAQALENERDLTAAVSALVALQGDAVAANGGHPVTTSVGESLTQALTAEQGQLDQAQRGTDVAVVPVQQLAQDVFANPAFPASVRDAASSVIAQVSDGDLDAIRLQVIDQSPTSVIADYAPTLTDLFALNAQVAGSSGDAVLTNEVNALGALSQAEDQAAQQRAILDAAFIESGLNDAGGKGRVAPFNTVGGVAAMNAAGGLQALVTAQDLQLTDLSTFQTAATQSEQEAYLARQVGNRVVAAGDIYAAVTSDNGDPQAIFPQLKELISGLTPTSAPAQWYADQSAVVNGMQVADTQIATEIVARSQVLQHQAFESALVTGLGTALVVILVLGVTGLIGRSLVNPLRRLQADALDIAAVRLPARVAAASANTEAQEGLLAVEPIGVQSTDEIGRVARAFDHVHAEAVRLASNEAQLRGSLNAMFISLSRRSVPLIERLARMIDSMEQNEDDPDQLANLFSMDHMVTRMRRNSENLLVLAGEEPVRKWTESVPLSDVARAAAAEIEQYNRVALAVQPGIMISGQAAADVVHLLAELIENATLFSPQSTQVRVTVMELNSGGVLVEVRDDGVGISAGRLADMNWRLDHPPVVDVSISRHMGLYAVSRLAARHGIKVRLRPGTPQGLSALVWLPGHLATNEPDRARSGRSRPIDVGQEAWTRSARRPAARQRNGHLATSGDQPALAGRTAAAGRPGTVWFTAKRPSGGPVRASGEIAAGWQSPASGRATAGVAAPRALSDSGGPAPAEQAAAQTTSGLPRRVPQLSVRPGAEPQEPEAQRSGMPVAAPAAVLGAPADALPTRPVPAARQAAPVQQTHEQAPPRRRSPDEVRSRLSGFQLGSRDAVTTDREAGWTQQAGEENGR
jgi:signal transduction histidine kinase